MRIARNAWIVVCDGGKARIFENSGSAAAIKLATREVLGHANAPTHEQGTDTPGRVQQSFSNARSAVEQTDWHAQAERDFLESLAHRLDAALVAREVSDLVIIAPPRALGVLRGAYSSAIRQALRGEIDKDYVKLAVPEIEKHLAG